MSNNYYKEAIFKDCKNRGDYLKSLTDFLDKAKVACEKARQDYISPEKLLKDPDKYREDLKSLLGFPLTENRIPAKLKSKTLIAEDNNVLIYRMNFIVFGDIVSYGILFQQKQDFKTKPFVYCLHGGGGTPEVIGSINQDSDVYHHLARRFTDKGASVYCPQFLLWEKDVYGSLYDRVDIDSKLRQLGGSITALETFILSQTLDYFINEEEVDENKIGVAGLSYGGMYALYFAACDARIKACCSSSWFNDRFKYSWADWSYKCAQRSFTDCEVAALVCPRALVLTIGDKDCMFESSIAEERAQFVKEYYKYINKEDKFIFYIYKASHEFDKSDEGIDLILKELLYV